MLALLPLFGLALLIVWQALAVRPGNRTTGWEHPCLVAATIWGALAVVLVELLGAARALTPTTLALGWAGATLLLVVLVIRRARAANGRAWRLQLTRPTRSETVFGVLLIVYLAALLVVALASPPNNTDSLQYHMARVAHWIQNRSLAHYASQYEPQLFNPPGAEILILTLQVLFGSDRLANLVQWAAFLGALTAVSGISRALGVGKSGRMAAIGFAAVVPMAVLQATSTQNDLVGAFWLLTFAFFVTRSQVRAFSTAEWAATGLALGLSILTKTTQYVYGLPFLILLAACGWKGNRLRRLGQLTIVLGLAAVLCLPAWWRNQSLFGTLLGPPDLFQEHSVAVGGAGRVLEVPLRGLRMILINLTSSSATANAWAADAVRAIYARLGLEVEEPLFIFAWSHEDLAGSPLHVLAAGFAAVIVLARWKKNRVAGQYAACVVAGYLMLPWMLASISRPFMIRHQLPFYMAGAPLVAILLNRWVPSRALGAISSLILLLGLPWLLFNNTRPLVGLRPDASGGLELPCIRANLLGYECTRIGSVLTMPEVDVLFANIKDSEDDALAMVAALEQTGCRQVGLRIDSHDPEYVYWRLLDAPRRVYRLETIYTVPRLEPLIDRSFSPCAIICTICGDRDRLHGLDLYHAAGEVKLFVGDGFTWNEDG
jgi:hypothetical protein